MGAFDDAVRAMPRCPDCIPTRICDYHRGPGLGDVNPLSGREYCPRCSSGPRQLVDTEECPDCGYKWAGPPLLSLVGGE